MQRYPVALYRYERERISLEVLAERTGVHPQRIYDYVELGLLEPCEREGGADPSAARLLFDLAALTRLRAIERLRRDLGVNLAGVSVILDLVERVRLLQREVERLK